MSTTFASFGLLPSLLKTLEEQHLSTPTEIQAQVIPALLAGRSVVGVAETGSGKTLAYALPILHQLKQLEDSGTPVTTPRQPRALIVVPTRELGDQVTRVVKGFTHDTRLRVRAAVGSVTTELARRGLAGEFEVLVATPGRLMQLVDSRGVSLAAVRILVLDEADQLLEMGFLNEVARMVDQCSPARQLALFSATIPKKVEALIEEVFDQPVILKTKGSHRIVASSTTDNRQVDPRLRFPALEALVAEGDEPTLIFVNTRAQCDEVAEQLRGAGFECAVYRGEMDALERRANLRSFREGRVSLLVATDLGARGLDVPQVSRVINYHLPKTVEAYLHRSGRTARAGRPGLVVNLVVPKDEPLLRRLESITPGRRAQLEAAARFVEPESDTPLLDDEMPSHWKAAGGTGKPTRTSGHQAAGGTGKPTRTGGHEASGGTGEPAGQGTQEAAGYSGKPAKPGGQKRVGSTGRPERSGGQQGAGGTGKPTRPVGHKAAGGRERVPGKGRGRGTGSSGGRPRR